MTTYPTKYSNLNDFYKKERKIKANQYPYIAPNSNLSNIDWCGQKVNKQDVGSNIKFCPLCDQPMIVRMMMIPCEHVICYTCSKPDSGYCYICESTVTQVTRIPDKQKLYECDFPDCFKFFESIDKLGIHKYLIHNQQVSIDPNLLKQDNTMMNQMPMQRFPMIQYQGMMPSPQNIMNAPSNLFLQPTSNFPNIHLDNK